MMAAVTGGAASGKSAFAEGLIVRTECVRKIYLATMAAGEDEESRARIERHRALRAGKGFETVERTAGLDRLSLPAGSAVLLEDLANLAANELFGGGGDAEEDWVPDGKDQAPAGKDPVRRAAERIMAGIERLRRDSETLVVVTDEIFSDGVRYSAETEGYRALLGYLNRRVFAEADEVWEVICGIAVPLKAAPLTDNQGNKEVHMTFLTGGAYQGKLEFAKELLSAETTAAGDVETAAAGDVETAAAGAAEMKTAGDVETTVAGDAETAAGDAEMAAAGAGETMVAGSGEITVADGEKDSFEAAYTSRIVANLHEYIRRLGTEGGAAAARVRLDGFLSRLIAENGNAVVTADEVGCGVIPMEADERLWRELCGEAAQRLAARSETVYRIEGGLARLLKGEAR